MSHVSIKKKLPWKKLKLMLRLSPLKIIVLEGWCGSWFSLLKSLSLKSFRGWSMLKNQVVWIAIFLILTETTKFIPFWIRSKILYFEVKLLKKFEDGHNRWVQKLVADSSDDFNQRDHQILISLYMSFYFSFIKYFQTFFALSFTISI